MWHEDQCNTRSVGHSKSTSVFYKVCDVHTTQTVCAILKCMLRRINKEMASYGAAGAAEQGRLTLLISTQPLYNPHPNFTFEVASLPHRPFMEAQNTDYY